MHVLAGLKAAPAFVYAVTSIEVVAPTVVPDVAAAMGVTVTSVLPAETETVGAPGAAKVHCGYKVRLS